MVMEFWMYMALATRLRREHGDRRQP